MIHVVLCLACSRARAACILPCCSATCVFGFGLARNLRLCLPPVMHRAAILRKSASNGTVVPRVRGREKRSSLPVSA